MSLPPYDQSIRDLERQYQVVLPDSVGQAALGFRDGVWFRVNCGTPRPTPLRSAIILCPHAAGSLVQITCWWMRENGRTPRALDLATELALTVGELARKAIEDDPLGMSLDTISAAPSPSPSPGMLGLPPGSGYPSAGSGSFGSSSNGYAAGSFAGAGATGYDAGAYATPAYQNTNDPYATPYPSQSLPPSSAAAAATTVLPAVPSDGYTTPPSPRGPAVPPRGGAGGQGLGSGGYPQRPVPLSGQPIRPQQGGRYPQQSGGRPQQGRPTPRPSQYENEPYRGNEQQGRSQRPTARPDSESW